MLNGIEYCKRDEGLEVSCLLNRNILILIFNFILIIYFLDLIFVYLNFICLLYKNVIVFYLYVWEIILLNCEILG